MPDNKTRHQFLKVDVDSEISALPASTLQRAVNLWLERGNVTGARGNVLVNYALPEGRNKVVGFCDDTHGGVLYFLWNAEGQHRIVRFTDGACATVLEWEGLALAETVPVLGAGVLDELLLFLDSKGDLRSVNLQRAAAGVYTPAFLAAAPLALHVVKPAPTFYPEAARGVVPGATTLVDAHSYQFALAYGYADGERTPLGPYTPVLLKGYGNAIPLYLPFNAPIPADVTELFYYVRIDNDPTWQQVVVRTRALDGPMFGPGNTEIFYGFTNGSALPATDAAKNFESLWPARAMTIARSRVFAADFLEGYATPQVNLKATLVPQQAGRTLKTNSAVELGIQFYDAVQRPFGVALPVASVVPIPGASYPTAPNTSPGMPTGYDLQWELPTTDPAQLNAEIPAEAAYYAIVASTNRRASFFWQTITADIGRLLHYAASSGGDYEAGDPVLDVRTRPGNKLWLDVGSMGRTGQNTYVFTPGSGDRVLILADGIDAPITQQRGDFIEIETTATPASNTTRIEIYSPNAVQQASAFYEKTPLYPIARAADGSRHYTTRSGTIEGDAYFNQVRTFYHDEHRNGGSKAGDRQQRYYLIKEGPNRDNPDTPPLQQWVETPNPDKAASVWFDASRGRVAVYLPEGSKQVRRRSLLRYSGVKVQGTKLNGLSVWDATSQDDLPQEQGAVVRLAVADQTQADGSLLLCVQERGAESRYLGQTALQQADGQTTLALTKGVIGGGNALRGGYGLLPRHAASFQLVSGRAFWYCHEKREYIRYAQNGLTPLAVSYQFRARLREVGDLLGEGPAVGGYDPRRDELWLSFPNRDVAATASEKNRGGIAQEQLLDAVETIPGRTLVWSERRETWVDSYDALPECMGYTGITLVSFQNGSLWHHHDAAPYGSFFGRYTAPSLTFTSAAPGIKIWKNITLESEAKWLPARLSIEGRMQSRMLPAWLTYLEGVYRGAFRKDETSRGGLLNGRPLIGQRLTLTLTAPAGQEGVPLTAVQVGWASRGGQL